MRRMMRYRRGWVENGDAEVVKITYKWSVGTQIDYREGTRLLGGRRF
jgi:hypothetical protein